MSPHPRIATHHWGPYQPLAQVVGELAARSGRVLEIGPGNVPLSAAHVFVDWQVAPALAGKPVHVLDLNQDPLPLADKSFDFSYCRQTLEVQSTRSSSTSRSGTSSSPSCIG